MLTTNGDLYGDNGSGVCKVLSTPTSALSGSGTATHLPIWSAGSTLGDSPATFDGTTFVFPNPFSVQAHVCVSAWGAIVDGDSGTWNGDLGGPLSTIGILQETSTAGTGINGLVVAPTWNPSSDDGASGPFGIGVDFNLNTDGQATAGASPIGLYTNIVSNGNTTGLGTLYGEYLGVTAAGNAPITNIEGLAIGASNSGTATVSVIQVVNGEASNAGTVSVAMVSDFESLTNTGTSAAMIGDEESLTNTGTSAGMVGGAVTLTNSGSGNTTGDVHGYQSVYVQSSASANPSDYLGFVSAPVISAGSFSGVGIVNFVADGENPITTQQARTQFPTTSASTSRQSQPRPTSSTMNTA